MSQHGAQGAALQGLTHQEIVAFYYPGTTPGTAKGKVSVLISADTSKDVQVLAEPGLKLRVLASGKVLDLAKARPQATALAGHPGQRGTRRGVVPHRGLEGCSAPSTGDAELFRTGARDDAGAPVRRQGRLPRRPALGEEGHRQRAAARQVPPGRRAPGGPGALGARRRCRPRRSRRAPTRRTSGRTRSPSHYQICDTTSCQVYGGASAEHPAATAAIKASKGEVLLYDGAPAFTQFSASSGGWTSAGSAPYLVAKQDPYDGWSGNPHSAWQTVVSDGTVEKAFPGHRQPDPDPVLRPGRQRRVGRPGRHGDPHRQRGLQDGLRRGLPLPARPPLRVGQPDRDRGTLQSASRAPAPGRRRRRPGCRTARPARRCRRPGR